MNYGEIDIDFKVGEVNYEFDDDLELEKKKNLVVDIFLICLWMIKGMLGMWISF